MLLLPINEKLLKLLPWQQSVFSLALAQHTILHFRLFCETIDSPNIEVAEKIHQLLWDKLISKGTKINFEIQQNNFEELIPDASKNTFYGVYPALDFCVIMSCAFNTFITKSEEEALNASQTTFGTIASFIELQSDIDVNEDDLINDELIKDELNFQNLLLDKLNDQRSPELIKSIKALVIDYGVTNLGIELS